jgi:DNA-binding NarL/FixJ family response regulator
MRFIGSPMTPHETAIRVLVCNKYTLFREGIKALFLEGPAIEVVGEAATGTQVLELLERVRPDVVLLDATTPDSGSDVTRRIKAINPNVEVLILSLGDDEQLISGCLDAGAAGYIRKDDEPLTLRQAISTAYREHHRAA